MNNAKLFPYQEIGVDWLSDRRFALLADEMGLGKSAQAIQAADNILADKICVICPAVARRNWYREFHRFGMFSRHFFVPEGNGQDSVGAHSIICSYDYAASGGINADSRFDLLILDEAHFIKSPEAKRTLAIFGEKGVARRSKRTWAITGTPMPNHPGELWVMLKCFGVHTGSYTKFCDSFCEYAPGYKDHLRIVGARREMLPSLRNLIAPVMLQRTVEEVLPDLPRLHFGDVVVEPGKVKLSVEEIEKVAREMESLAGMIDFTKPLGPEAMNALELMAKSVSTLRRYNGMQKVDPVAEMVNQELDSGAYKKIVIFASHTTVIQQLLGKLAHHGADIIVGATSAKNRELIIDRFQTDDSLKVIICNIIAAGTAINLTASNQVLFVETEWSPGTNAQAARRCRRIGSTRPVMARFVGIADSIDEKIQKILRRKSRDIGMLLAT